MSGHPIMRGSLTAHPIMRRPSGGPQARALGAESAHPTEARIDLLALKKNFLRAKRAAGRRPLWAVVKADGYGHGALAVSRALISAGADRLAVAFATEGIELRRAKIAARILVMGGFSPDEGPELIRYRLTPVVYDLRQVEALGRWASRAVRDRRASLSGRPVPLHLKIDTGMGRLGIPPAEAPRFIERIAKTEGVFLEGIMSHFSEADLADRTFARKQIETLLSAARGVAREKPEIHIANSAALLTLPSARLSAVRPGIMLYGIAPTGKGGLLPVLTLATCLFAVKRVPPGTTISYGRTFVARRDSLIGTLPIGYADGFPRSLSNRGWAVLRGRRAPVAGRVCMDMTMIDLTDIEKETAAMGPLLPGEEVILIGPGTPAEEVAKEAGTIPYELLARIGQRVPRIYSEGGEAPSGFAGGGGDVSPYK